MLDILPDSTVTSINALEKEEASTYQLRCDISSLQHVPYKFCHVAAGCSIMYHTFTISYIYIYTYICFFSIHVIQDSCWYPLQVRITSGDLLALDQVNRKNRQQTFKKLFTNDGTLKINVGGSHKGWRLVCVKNTKANTASEAYKDALQRLWSLIKSGEKKIEESTSFLLVGCSDRKQNKNPSSKVSWQSKFVLWHCTWNFYWHCSTATKFVHEKQFVQQTYILDPDMGFPVSSRKYMLISRTVRKFHGVCHCHSFPKWF